MRGRQVLAAIALGLALSPLAAAAQSLPDAEAFVRRLYRAYEHNGSPDYLGRQMRQVFSPRLIELIRRDQRLTPKGDAPELDGDPICGCQDSAGLRDVRVSVADAGPGRAQARVRYRFDDGPSEKTVDLVTVQGRWRVDDVHSRDMPSLVRFLENAHRPSRRR